MSRILARRLATVGAAIGLTLACSISADAQDRVRWKMQSAFVQQSGRIWVRPASVSPRTSNACPTAISSIKFYEPGALVPALECFDAASKGSVEACWTTPGYHTGKIPALAFFTTVPFGPQYGEFFAWKKFHGGDQLKNEIYGEHGLYSIDVFSIGPETSGWFREPIESLDQLKGLKMRFFGLGAQVMTKLGVSTQLLAGADIYPALERGVIDATEFSMPDIDIDLGFYQVAKNNYYPGLASAGFRERAADEQSGLGGAVRPIQGDDRARRGGEIHYTYAETEAITPRP